MMCVFVGLDSVVICLSVWGPGQSWDLVDLTKNYFSLILDLVLDPEPNSGVLIHCISGWDRTPMFISLLRLSLWADGEVMTF